MPVLEYPGVTGVVSADVTTSVGITPATITLVVYPDSNPVRVGTLKIGDDTNPPLTFPDCFCREPAKRVDRNANEMVLQFQDRRWRWKYGFPSDGHWNQEAGSGKFVPWTVRSPWQMAYRLLELMGEKKDPLAQIDLPGGLAQPGLPKGPGDRFISAAGQYLSMGQNLALSQTNPETNWGTRPAAQCLADLAEFHGRIVVLNPLDDTVYLKKLGDGAALPAGTRTRTGATTQFDAIPTRVYARGVADEFQLRLRLRAVAREWDRSWRPVNEVSYAPPNAGQSMRVIGYGTGAFDRDRTFAVVLNGVPFVAPPGTVPASGTGSGWPGLAAWLAGQINTSGDTRIDGRVYATVDVNGRLQLDGVRRDGSAPPGGYEEFEALTDGTDEPPANTWTWNLACVRGPIRGTYKRQNVWRVVWPVPDGGRPDGDVYTLVVNGTAYQATATVAGSNNVADALALLAAKVDPVTTGATAVAGGNVIVVTGATPGAAVAVSADAAFEPLSVVEEVATVNAPSKGWERTAAPFGAFARVPLDPTEFGSGQLNIEQARRLANESVMTCYQVVCEDPADGRRKSIPVPEVGRILNRFLLLLQADSPEPVTPEPGLAEAIDLRTLQPFAAATYSGYAVRRPNRVYGSVARGLLARDGVLWRGGTYLQHNTRPRALLPLQCALVDPEQQVFQFSQPLYRWLGTNDPLLLAVNAGTATWWTTQPAELVVEVGALCLDANALSPRATSFGADVPGGFGPELTRVFPDIRREVLGTYDERHALTGSRPLDADARERAARYADGLAKTFQAPVGEETEFAGLLSIPLDGRTRQLRWRVSKSDVSTSASVNCETSRVVPPYPARRRAENLPPSAALALQNLLSDMRGLGALNNAMRVAFGPAGLGQGGR